MPRSFRFAGRGNALRDAGQYDRALADYETALKLAPTDAWILLDRGRAYARMGRSQAARNDFDTALTLDPSNEELQRYIATELASPSIRNGTPPLPPPPVPQPPVDGLEDVRRKAENGDPIAQLKLGRMYANGTSLAKDDTQAVAWFRKAAERGYADAQYELASCYDTGRGVTKDGALAVDWYRKAAAQGHQDARNRLDERASLIQHLRSTITRIQDELTIIPPEARERVKEVAARLATARDTMPLPDLNALRTEADNATAVLDKAREFRRVSEIASNRMAIIEEELAQITSDAPIMRKIQDAIETVKVEQTGSNLSSLQGALENLNKLYDTNRGQLQQWKFKVH